MEISNVLTAVSLLIALIAVLLTLWQNSLTRKAVQSQVLLSLKQQAKEAEYFEGMAAIMALKEYTAFEAYQKGETVKTQQTIYATVDFLNFVAHLVEDDFLPRQTAWNYYFHAYRICNRQLLPWWLDGIRRDRFQGFTSFEKMCIRIGRISDAVIQRVEAKHSNSLARR